MWGKYNDKITLVLGIIFWVVVLSLVYTHFVNNYKADDSLYKNNIQSLQRSWHPPAFPSSPPSYQSPEYRPFVPETIANLNRLDTVGRIQGEWRIKDDLNPYIGRDFGDFTIQLEQPCSDPRNNPECNAVFIGFLPPWPHTVGNDRDRTDIKSERIRKDRTYYRGKYRPYEFFAEVSLEDGTLFDCIAKGMKLVMDDYKAIPLNEGMSPCPVKDTGVPNHLWLDQTTEGPNRSLLEFLGKELYSGHKPIAVIRDGRKILIEGNGWNNDFIQHIRSSINPDRNTGYYRHLKYLYDRKRIDH